MANSENPVAVLTDDECWERLGSHQLGRLITRVGDVLDVFPVNYVVDGRSIVFRTAAGGKLSSVVVSDAVLFEVDDYSVLEGWSVVVRGHAALVERADEVAAAERLPLRPMAPTVKLNFVRIVPGDAPGSVSGRSFERAGEPDVYEVFPY